MQGKRLALEVAGLRRCKAFRGVGKSLPLGCCVAGDRTVRQAASRTPGDGEPAATRLAFR